MKHYQPDEDEMWRDPDNWRWGIFYYNPRDERLFVPKRIPVLGVTLNFANPQSYIILILLLGVILFATLRAIFKA